MDGLFDSIDVPTELWVDDQRGMSGRFDVRYELDGDGSRLVIFDAWYANLGTAGGPAQRRSDGITVNGVDLVVTGWVTDRTDQRLAGGLWARINARKNGEIGSFTSKGVDSLRAWMERTAERLYGTVPEQEFIDGWKRTDVTAVASSATVSAAELRAQADLVDQYGTIATQVQQNELVRRPRRANDPNECRVTRPDADVRCYPITDRPGGTYEAIVCRLETHDGEHVGWVIGQEGGSYDRSRSIPVPVDLCRDYRLDGTVHELPDAA
ncbi:MAG: hypothetical protein AAFZ07_19500 [Actinomycetota bacterium]